MWKQDFDAERNARERQVQEKEGILQEMKNLQTQNQQLLDEIETYSRRSLAEMQRRHVPASHQQQMQAYLQGNQGGGYQPQYPQAQPQYPQAQPQYPSGQPQYPPGQPQYPPSQPQYQQQPPIVYPHPNSPQEQPRGETTVRPPPSPVQVWAFYTVSTASKIVNP